MKNFVESYKSVMSRTRWIGIAGAILMILQIMRELFAIYSSLAVIERPLPDDLLWIVVRDMSLAVLISVSLVYRLWVLRFAVQGHYLTVAISWALPAGLFLVYLYRDFFSRTSDCIPGPNYICFSFYDISRADQIEIAAVLFLFASVLRAVVTMIAALFLPRTRLK